MVNERNIRLTAYAAACISVLSTVLWLGKALLVESYSFDTDEADHANAALELYRAVLQLDLNSILAAILNQSFYPPLQSLTILPAYLVFSPDLFSSRLPSLFLFVLGGLLVVSAFHKTEIKEQGLLGALALVLFVTAPEIQVHASLCMMEILGLFLFLLLLRSILRSQEGLAIFVLVLIWFTKYSFGLIATGGFLIFHLLKWPVRATFILKCLGCLSMVATLWAIVSDFQSIKAFFLSHPSYVDLLSLENFVFYPHSIANNYHLHPIIGYIVLALATTSALKFFSEPLTKACISFLLGAFIILTLSTTNEARHILPVVPFLWILSVQSVRILAATRLPIIIFILCLPVLALLRIDYLNSNLLQSFETKPDFNEMYGLLAESIDHNTPILVCGFSDQFGREAMNWELARRNSLAYSQIRVDSYPYSKRDYLAAKNRKRKIPAPWLEEKLPAKPLTEVLDSGYFKTVLYINQRGQKNKKAESCNRLLEERAYPHRVLKTKSLEVTIYRINLT